MSHVVAIEEIKRVPPHMVYPLSYGNEEETGLMINTTGIMDEPYEMCKNMVRYMPPDIIHFLGDRSIIFTEGAFKLYPGGAKDAEGKTNPERATPEVVTLDDFVRYSRGSDLLIEKVIGNFVARASADKGHAVSARQQRRTVDGESNRKAVHDNFAIPRGTPVANGRLLRPLLRYLTAAPILDGAGYVDDNGVYFSQKIGGLEEITNHTFSGSMYRKSYDEGTPRLEVRCKDANISDWAVRMRAGSMALTIGLAQTPLAKQMLSIDETKAIDIAQGVNRLGLRLDGTISASAEQIVAVDYLQKIAELTLSKMALYVESVPDELYKVASELYEYAEDFKKITSSEATIALLADRADWAAKFDRILKKLHKDRATGMERSLTDIHSQYADMKYDYKGYWAVDGVLQPIEYGFGYLLRERGQFRGKPVKFVEATLTQPPRNTRAKLRTELMRNYHIVNMDWDWVIIADQEQEKNIMLSEVRQHNFTANQKREIATIRSLTDGVY